MNREQERARMEALWAVDTNKELEVLLKDTEERSGKRVSIKRVAELCLVSYDTAVSWLVRRDSPKWRRMPNSTLALLEARLALIASAEAPTSPQATQQSAK